MEVGIVDMCVCSQSSTMSSKKSQLDEPFTAAIMSLTKSVERFSAIMNCDARAVMRRRKTLVAYAMR